MTALTKTDLPGALLELSQVLAAAEGTTNNIQVTPDFEDGVVSVTFAFPGSVTVGADGTMSLSVDDYVTIADFDPTSILGEGNTRSNAAATLVELTSKMIRDNAALVNAGTELPEDVTVALGANLSTGAIAGNFNFPIDVSLSGGDISVAAVNYFA